ncbi:MAG: hypothetical protein KAY65_14305 [Planctomycetes bacterium]|nr:hypothetical protein [Planctomycetota bacterium]
MKRLPVLILLLGLASPAPAKLPDLFTHTVSDRFSPAQLSPSDRLNVRYLVSNNGTLCIPENPWCPEMFGPANGPWVEAVFLSKDPYPEAGDILLGTVTFGGTLGPHGSHEVQTQFQVPADCPFGDYKVIIYADYVPGQPAGALQETNESNNWDDCQGTLAVIPRLATFYVDDDASTDPRPNDPSISDPCEDGTAAHPFDAIQEAIDATIDLDTIIVLPGKYSEQINFLGKDITLTSTRPNDSRTVKSTTIDGSLRFRGTEGPNCTLRGFNINGSITGYDWEIDPEGENHTHATISHSILENIATGCGGVVRACDGVISNCIVANISYMCLRPAPVAQIVACHGLIRNCTMVNVCDGIEIEPNRTCTLENCVLYHSSPIIVAAGATLNISYCNMFPPPQVTIEEGTVIKWGLGNTNNDPCFADPENGDYHVKSQAGRYDPPSADWILDEVTSLCIDAGNPISPIGNEPFPNGGIINMGTYGGTPEASKSYFGRPPCQTIMAGDINGDCKINFKDFFFIALHWLEDSNP